jgi:hypothetical protein
VDLGDDLEGFVPMSQLGVDNLKKPADSFSEGDEIPLRATRVDIPNHRIVLSVKAYMMAQDQAVMDEFRVKHMPKPPTLADVTSDEVKEAGAAGETVGAGDETSAQDTPQDGQAPEAALPAEGAEQVAVDTQVAEMPEASSTEPVAQPAETTAEPISAEPVPAEPEVEPVEPVAEPTSEERVQAEPEVEPVEPEAEPTSEERAQAEPVEPEAPAQEPAPEAGGDSDEAEGESPERPDESKT